MGITVPNNLPSFKKENSKTLIFVGRLLKAKGVEDAIMVCSKLKEKYQGIKLWIVGRGEEKYTKKIRQLAKDLNIEKQVKFLDFLSQEKKFEMMGRAHILLAPSIREGYGLTVPEAAIVGTPAVAYNVEGLRDIITDEKNGFLTDCTVDDMVKKVDELLPQPKLYIKVAEEATKYAKRLKWENTAKVAWSVIKS